jgi:hypothetical protein
MIYTNTYTNTYTYILCVHAHLPTALLANSVHETRAYIYIYVCIYIYTMCTCTPPNSKQGPVMATRGFKRKHAYTHPHTHAHTQKGPVTDTRGVQTTEAPEEEATMVEAGGGGMVEGGEGGGVTGDMAR